MSIMQQKNLGKVLVAIVAVLGMVVFTSMRWKKPVETVPVSVSQPAASGAPAEPEPSSLNAAKVEQLIRAIAQAEADAHNAIERRLGALEQLFQKARERAPQFADRALSLRSKWIYIKTYLPGADKQAHLHFLQKEFTLHIFAPEDLEQAIRQTAMLIVSDIREIENRMLVALQADLKKLPRVPGVSVPKVDAQVLDDVLKQIQHDTGRDVAADVGLFVASEVMASVACQLAATAGVVGAGAAGAVPTLGLSLVAAFIDVIVTRIYNAVVDPRGQITSELQRSLTQLEQLLIEGEGTQPGLRDAFKKLVSAWAEKYTKTLTQTLTER